MIHCVRRGGVVRMVDTSSLGGALAAALAGAVQAARRQHWRTPASSMQVAPWATPTRAAESPPCRDAVSTKGAYRHVHSTPTAGNPADRAAPGPSSGVSQYHPAHPLLDSHPALRAPGALHPRAMHLARPGVCAHRAAA